MANTDGNIIIGTTVDMYGMNTGLKRIQKSMNKLRFALGNTLGIAGFVQLGKAALNAASDLQEVQNIVDVAFGEMAYKAEAFASTCIEKFGMSELAAKQTAGSFMAMGKSMGLTMDQASNMAISLTGLTADMASFYNISQDYARVALSAVYTGETETLKRYGIVLTEANLQQYANTLGIQKSVKAMGSQEKAMLRYQYILKATNDMQGDFARTSGSWANQTRLLKEQWTVFLNVLGSGLITVLTPVLKMLNALIAAVTRFARIIGSALANIFGFKIQPLSNQLSGAGASAGAAADSMEDLAGATDKAGKAAKKALAPWDDLNVLMDDTTSAAGGGGGGGGDLDFSIPDPDSQFKNLKDDLLSGIDNLFDLGRYISDKLTEMLKNIPWDKIYEGARNFGKGLAEFLNGLITPDLFYQLGRTIANALNTALYFLESFALEFDWTNFGLSLAAGVNGFFENFDFATLANTIDAWVQGIYKTVKTFIENVNWSAVWDGVKTFLSNLDIDTVAIVIDFLVLKSIGKFVFGTAPALIAKALAKAIAEAWAAGGGLAGLAEGFSLFAGGAAASLPEAMGAVFGTLGAVLTAISAAVAGIGGLVLAVVNFFAMWENGWDVIKTILEAVGIAIAAIAAILLGAPIAAAAAIAAAIFALSQLAIAIHDHWEEIKEILANLPEWVSEHIIEPVKNFLSGLWETVTTKVGEVIDSIKGKIQPIVDWLQTNIFEPVHTFFSGLWTGITTTVSTTIETIKQKIQPIVDWFQSNIIGPIQFAIEWISSVVQAVWIIIKAILILVATWIETNVIEPVKTFFVNLWNDIVTGVNTAIETVKTVINDAWVVIQETLAVVSTWIYENVILPIQTFFTNLINDIRTTLQTWWAAVQIVFNTIATVVKTVIIDPIVTHFNTFITNLRTKLRTAWNAIKTVIATVKGIVMNNIITPLTNAFNTLWEDIKSGVKSTVNFVIEKIEGMINKIIDAINNFTSGLAAVAEVASAITGDSFGGIPQIPHVSLPRLAQGAVIPPNRQFMAILGDQKSGTNIEAPLDTIVEAMRIALEERGGSSSETVNLQIDGETLARLTLPYNLDEMHRRGYNVSVLGV